MRLAHLLALGGLLAASPFAAAGPLVQDTEVRGWGPEQALGAPDTPGSGDLESAWASKTEDDADEWLVLVFPEAVVPTAVRVFETFNPGALVAVSVIDADGGEHEVWRGIDPVLVGSERGISVVPFAAGVRTDTIKLHLASRAVEGWNEIDAVGLHGPDGSLQWAVDAWASSTFSAGEPRAPQRIEPLPPVALDELDPAHRTRVDGLLDAYVRLRATDAEAEPLALLAREVLARQSGGDGVAPTGFAGLWSTTYGELALAVDEGVARGSYALGTVEGRVVDERLELRYQEESVAGEAVFELAGDGQGFSGRWRPDGTEEWRPWEGRRIAHDPSITWLVVLEAPWQSGLTEPEYSFGGMLSAIFDHAVGVNVRQRYFASIEGLEHACAEAARLPGPVVLLIAAHGGPKGVYCAGGTVPAENLARAFAGIPHLRTVHFSSCSVMGGDVPDRILAALASSPEFEGVSGYTRPVDWMGSALCEFAYLELLLGRHLPAPQAAEALPKLLTFAGRRAPDGSPIPASHFRFVGPGHAPADD